MADNTTLNAGTGGDVYRSNDRSGVKTQVVQLDHGTDSAELVGQDMFAEDVAHTSGDLGIMTLSVRTDVPIARAGTDGDYQPLITDAAGRLWIARSHYVGSATPTIDTAAYAANDAQGGVIEITNVAHFNNGPFAIVGATITDRDTDSPVRLLHFYQNTPTSPPANNAAYDLTDANHEAAIYLGTAEFITYRVATSNRFAEAQHFGQALSAAPIKGRATSAGTSVYCQFQLPAAYTAASNSDLVLNWIVERL